MTRRRVRGKRLILAYHGIIPEGETDAGERALFLPQRDFAEHLDVLSAEADVVPLNEIDEPGNGRPRVAITFDDAYAGAVNEGVGELVARSLPATIFVAPGRLDRHIFWWDALSHGVEELNPTVRAYALLHLAGADAEVRSWARSEALALANELPAYARAATHAELAAAVALPGITVGSHTWSHRNLTALAASELDSEVRESRQWLRQNFGAKAIDWIAYPYGLDSFEVQRAAVNASYAGGLRSDGGWHRAVDVSAFSRPRLCVGSRLSATGLRTRLNGARLQ